MSCHLSAHDDLIKTATLARNCIHSQGHSGTLIESIKETLMSLGQCITETLLSRAVYHRNPVVKGGLSQKQCIA